MTALALPASARPNLPLALPGSSTPSAAAGPSRLATPLLALPPQLKVEPRDATRDSPDDEDEEEEDDELEEKKRAAAKNAKKTGGKKDEGVKEYKYSSEISQMDPLNETVRLVEDIVRGQIIEIVTRARLLTHLRSSRFLSAEDVIFLIREDRSKVNRLRTYLAWKDVRKRAKEDAGGAVEGPELDTLDEADKAATMKGRKTMVKLPWELMTPFGDFLKSLPGRSGIEDEEEDDDDERQAYHDSMQRLRDADEATKKMTKDEYVHYSDCRQASFTYRKARRFREFINFGAYLDVKPNDEIVDILGFLAFEMVRSLCVTALEVRDRLEQSAPSRPKTTTIARRQTILGSPVKRKSTLDNISPPKKARTDGSGGVESPESTTESATATAPASALAPGAGATTTSAVPATGSAGTTGGAYPVSLFAPPPSARSPLLPAHVLEAFAQIQRVQAAGRGGSMRRFRGGLNRARVALV